MSTGTQSSFGSPDTYTPKDLARRILNSRAALEGERKQVTVLFADLKGSMELLADRDPEEARKLLDPVLEHMMEAVHHFEGTVSLVMGDGIMAIFGAPLSHEDHAVRACYAALRMQDLVKRHAEGVARSHGANVQIRVGLNSGEVVVRAIGSDLHMDYTAIGRTTHLASRMEQLAAPGSILLTPATLELAEGYVAVKPLGPLPIKGLSDALDVYEMTGPGPARTRLQAGARRGLTRFVGREAELAQLRRAQLLANDGNGQVVAFVAEAGVGKSRLVHEFTHSPEMQGWRRLACASVSYGRATSYLPVASVLKNLFEIHDGDDQPAISEKVSARVLALDAALESGLPALLALLGATSDETGRSTETAWRTLTPPQRRRRMLDAVRHLLLRLSRDQPLLLVFEDLHWIDGETQALLDELVDSLGSSRILLLVNYRPEYQHGWASKPYYLQTRLETLPVDNAGQLLDALLGDDPSLAPIKALFIRRGNPFFLEEAVRTLVEMKALDGSPGRYRLVRLVETIQIPGTVQTILAARIDRLPAEEKQLLQVASVIGRHVSFALLQSTTDLPDEVLRGGLDHLQAAEFVYESSLFPDRAYTFKHALTRDVAYGSLLQERRRELHARIVEAIETTLSDRTGEHIEQLAHHAFRGELREKAVSYLRQAALKSAERSASRDAKAWFEQALDVLHTLPESDANLKLAFDIRLELRPILLNLGEARDMLRRVQEAEKIGDRLSDDRLRARVNSFLASIHSLLGNLDEALEAGNRAVEIAGRLGDWRLQVLAKTYLGQAHCVRGDYEQAAKWFSDNLAALPAESMHERLEITVSASVYNRYWLILSLAHLGRFAEAMVHETEAIRHAYPTRHPMTVGLADLGAATLHLLRGDWVKARPWFEHCIAALRTGNVAALLPYGISTSSLVLAQLGETPAARDRMQEGEPLLRRQAETGYLSQCAWSYHILGRTCLLLGHDDEAKLFADRAIETSLRLPGFAAYAIHLLGDIASRSDHLDASAEAHFHRALALAEQRSMRPLIAHCHLGLGKLFQRTGKREQAGEHLTTATRLYREMDMVFWLEQAEAETRLLT